MSVALELAAGAQRMQYVLCIEGAGWPIDDDFQAAGYEGQVFALAERSALAALEAVLSAGDLTVHGGLTLPGSIADQLDPVTIRHTPGGLRFTIHDGDGWLTANMQAQAARTAGQYTLNEDVDWSETTIDIDTGGASDLGGTWVYIAGREAILLGSEANVAGDVYRYTGCLRGSLGTPRGRYDTNPTGLSAFTWESGTRCYAINPQWRNRRVVLLMHVPGEDVTEVVRLYTGRLRGITSSDHGLTWTLQTSAEVHGGYNPKRRQPRDTILSEDWVWDADHSHTWVQYPQHLVEIITDADPGTGNIARLNGDATQGSMRLLGLRTPIHGDNYDKYALAFAYAYRSVPGGTAGAVNAIVADARYPQSELVLTGRGDSAYAVWSIVAVGESLVRVLYKVPPWLASGIEQLYGFVVSELLNKELGNINGDDYEQGVPIRFLLDNYPEERWKNRFTVNGQVTRNVIDTVLCILTSMNNEYFIGDVDTGLGEDEVQFTAPGWTTDQWAGYALHCVEGVNKGEARVIESNDADTLILDRGFSDVPNTGEEYQIRNTIYDVLPLGWGLGKHHNEVDVESFESVRDNYLRGAKVGTFAIGIEDETDLWALITTNICEPFGALIYEDRATGKLSMRYVGAVGVNTVIGSYASVSGLLHVGSVDQMPRDPVERIVLSYRAYNKVVQTIERPEGDDINVTVGTFAAPGLSGGTPSTATVQIGPSELSHEPDDATTMAVSAMLQTKSELAALLNILLGRVREGWIPAPEVDVTVPLSYAVGTDAIHIGQVIAISDTTYFKPLNPTDGTRGVGWSALLARVIRTEIRLSPEEMGLALRLQLLPSTRLSALAPAATTTSKGTYGGGVDYFVVERNTYTQTDTTDYAQFAVGDRVELRSVTGAVKDGPYPIASFGTNEASTPGAASTDRINVTGSISPAIAAGDYVALTAWSSASNPAHMDAFAALADTAETLSTSDVALEYG